MTTKNESVCDDESVMARQDNLFMAFDNIENYDREEVRGKR